MKLDFKTLLIGLLLGICVTLSMGQRAAEPKQKLDADYRYQISAVGNGADEYTLFILDHETNKVYLRRATSVSDGQDIKTRIDRGSN